MSETLTAAQAREPSQPASRPASGLAASGAPRSSMLLALLLLFLGVALQGSRPLWDPDEGRYSNVALEMLDSGNWWVPHLHHEQPHFAKPPMTYWLIAGSVSLLGRNEWAIRLPYALAFVLTGLLVFDLARSLRLQPAWLPPAAWATSLGPFAAANLVTADAFLALFETCAVAAFVRSGALGNEPVEQRWIRLMWLAFAFGFLTKGPPALLPLLPIVAWLGVTRRGPALRASFDPVGLMLFAALGLGWYALMVAREPQLLRYFVEYEFIDRIFTGVHDRNASWQGMLKVYGLALTSGILPWGLVPLWQRAFGHRTTVAGPDSSRPQRMFLWLWMAIPLAVFMLAKSRLPLYLLPLFVPLALLVGPRLAVFWRSRPRLAVTLASLWIVALVGLKAVVAHVSTPRDARALAHEVTVAAAHMSSPMTEITFVGRRPAYGLRLYTGMPVEQVEIDPRPVAGPDRIVRLQSVCEEAAEPEHPLWLVPTSLERDFTLALRSCGFVPRQLSARVRDWTPFEVESRTTAFRADGRTVTAAAAASRRTEEDRSQLATALGVTGRRPVLRASLPATARASGSDIAPRLQ